MKRLYLLRHAKAASADGKIDDKDRPLNEIGREACARMALYLRKNQLIPELVLCSTALRTRETCERMLGGEIHDIRYSDALYLATAGGLLRAIQSAPQAVFSLMVISHNPGIHTLAVKLAREGKSKALDGLEEKFPTGALAAIDCPVERWKDIAPGAGFLAAFVKPNSL